MNNGRCVCVLTADFMQLLFACLQLEVFRVEKRSPFEGGSNESICKLVESGAPNPYKDFITYQKCVPAFNYKLELKCEIRNDIFC